MSLIDKALGYGVVMGITKTKGDTMSEFIGTIILVCMITGAAYWAGKTSMKNELRYWMQRTHRAECIADDMANAAMENYIDLAISELRANR